ncbi:uncharacterized protein METZ01_LOCUS354631 [marine metagenome]|uniref:Uncharacterized protein n=1 Tax=marine metagenome TaxID=408172 RepID=A0A382RXL7_9ZZZZ
MALIEPDARYITQSKGRYLVSGCAESVLRKK